MTRRLFVQGFDELGGTRSTRHFILTTRLGNVHNSIGLNAMARTVSDAPGEYSGGGGNFVCGSNVNDTSGTGGANIAIGVGR